MPLTVCTTVSKPRRDAQGPGAGRSRQHARDVDDADAVQGTIALGQGLGWTVADLHDLDQRQRGDGDALRVDLPFRGAPHHAARALTGDDRLLEVERLP